MTETTTPHRPILSLKPKSPTAPPAPPPVVKPPPTLKPRERIAELAQLHPDIFSTSGTPRPLAIGIDKALRAAHPEMSKSRVRRALGCYTNSPAYLRAHVENASRIDLSGKPKGRVTADQAARAQQRLAEMKERQKAEHGTSKPKV